MRPTQAAVDNGGDVVVALRCDDGLGVVVHLVLACLDVLLDMGDGLLREAQLLLHLLVTFKELDGIPAVLLLGQVVDRDLLDMGKRMLHATLEAMLRDGLDARTGQRDGLLSRLLDARALEGGDGNDLAVKRFGERGEIDHVAVLFHNVHHVDGDEHGNSQLHELRGEVEVALQIGAVHDVQDGVGTMVGEVVARHDLLEGVGRKRINTRKVGDRDVCMAFELAVLLLYRDARPVSDVLV